MGSTKYKLIVAVLWMLFAACIFVVPGIAKYSSSFSNSVKLNISSAPQSVYISNIAGNTDSFFDLTVFSGSIELSDYDINSTESFDITIYNDTDSIQYFEQVRFDPASDYSNRNIDFVLSGLDPSDAVENKESITFTITFKYSDLYKQAEHAQTLDNKLTFSLNFYFGYAVIFDLNGGEGHQYSYFVSAGEHVLQPVVMGIPFKENYAFMGWYDASDINAEYAQKYYDENQVPVDIAALNMPDGNIKLYAGWKSYDEITTTLTLQYNDNGNTKTQIAELHYGESITIPAIKNYRKTCYTFNSWNDEAGGSGTKYSENDVFTNTSVLDRDIILYGQWDPIVYSIIIYPADTDGNIRDVEPYVLDVIYGDSVNLSKAYFTPPEHYAFKQHLTKSGSTSWATWSGRWTYESGWEIDPVAHTLELIEMYEYCGYKIFYHANGGVGEDITEEIFTGEQIAIKDCLFTRDGYHFVDWSTSPIGTRNEYGWTIGGSWTWKYTNGQYGIANNELHFYAIWEKDAAPE